MPLLILSAQTAGGVINA